jgi:hypothetical protein
MARMNAHEAYLAGRADHNAAMVNAMAARFHAGEDAKEKRGQLLAVLLTRFWQQRIERGDLPPLHE